MRRAPVAIAEIRDDGRLKSGRRLGGAVPPCASRCECGSAASAAPPLGRRVRRAGILPGGWETLRFTTMSWGAPRAVLGVLDRTAIRARRESEPGFVGFAGRVPALGPLVRRSAAACANVRDRREEGGRGARQGKAAPEDSGEGREDRKRLQKEAEASRRCLGRGSEVRARRIGRGVRGRGCSARSRPGDLDVLGLGSAGRGVNQAVGGLRGGHPPDSDTEKGAGGMGARDGPRRGWRGPGIGGAGMGGDGTGLGGLRRWTWAGRRRTRFGSCRAGHGGRRARARGDRTGHRGRPERDQVCYEVEPEPGTGRSRGRSDGPFTIDGSGVVVDGRCRRRP